METLEQQVNEAFESLSHDCVPHVADKIEPGAILYSSWGYDQTNIDFYMVTRTTAKSAWIVPMSSPITEQVGWLCENVVAGEPLTHTSFCECRHSIHRHQKVIGADYEVCNGGGYEECECRECRPVPIKPAMHRIQRSHWSGEARESLHLTSYSNANLWEGNKLYASHYH